MIFKIIKPSLEEIQERSKISKFHSKDKNCLICNSSFNYGFAKTKICGLCKLEVKCDCCGDWFEYEFSLSGRNYYFDKELIDKIINNSTDDIKLYCKECLNNLNPGLCSICKTENSIRDKANRGKKECNCSKEWYIKHNNSENMRKIYAKNAIKYLVPLKEKYSKGGQCVICDTYNSVLDQCGRGKSNCSCSVQYYKKLASKLYEIKSKPGICTKCGEDSNNLKFKNRTAAGLCYNCQLKIAKNLSIKIKEQINNGTRKNWPGACNLAYFKSENNQEYYYDLQQEQYILWEEFKRKFKIEYQNIDFQKELKKLYPNILLQLTFRTQDSIDWTGAKFAFEQSLKENNIGYFVYIKFYIDSNNELKPLVVGKTGSKLVNYNGTDVSFSTELSHGPSRRFLKENNLEWCKTQILIIPCENEKESLNIEKQIALQFNLFQS